MGAASKDAVLDTLHARFPHAQQIGVCEHCSATKPFCSAFLGLHARLTNAFGLGATDDTAVATAAATVTTPDSGFHDDDGAPSFQDVDTPPRPPQFGPLPDEGFFSFPSCVINIIIFFRSSYYVLQDSLP